MDILLDHPWVFFVLAFAALLACVELGLRWRLRRRTSIDEARQEQIAGVHGSVVVLLGLFLGFTLALAPQRFEQRRELVVDEANSIATTRLRAEMLPEPYRGKVQSLLSDYVDARVEFFNAGVDGNAMQAALGRSKQLQNALWQQTVGAAQQSPTPVTAVFVSSENEMFDLGAKQLAALENRIPGVIWVLLLFMAVLACLTLGSSLQRRFVLAMIVIPLLCSVMIALIAELDSPRTGFLQVGLQSMQRLQSEAHSARAAH